MLETRGYAVKSAHSAFERFDFTRRELRDKDVLIQILFCGICHSDIHQARNEWGKSSYPMVPGHEITGKVVRIGQSVRRFKVGDLVGVGCFVDSCRRCNSCSAKEEQFCEKHLSLTYNGMEQDGVTPTYGGYSNQIVVDEHYVLHISSNLSLAHAAPLLCAGITTYSPLKRFQAGIGKRVGVIGLGGLGHMAVKFAAKMGANVTVFSTSLDKQRHAEHFGASDFIVTTEESKQWEVSSANRFDLIINTVSSLHHIDSYIGLLRRNGVMVLVGVPEKPLAIHSSVLIANRRNLTGSLIGGIKETQEMLDYCADENIAADIEVVPIQSIEEAYARTINGKVRYRFVIDMSTLQ